jgi:hypothetical protein
MVEDDQLVAFPSLGRNVPAFERDTVIGGKIDIPPSGHSIVVRRLVEDAPERFDDTSDGFDLGVVLLGDGLELLQGLSIRSLGILLMLFGSVRFGNGSHFWV